MHDKARSPMARLTRSGWQGTCKRMTARPASAPLLYQTHSMPMMPLTIFIDDLVSCSSEVDTIKGILSIHKNVLKHLYIVYSLMKESVDFDDALKQFALRESIMEEPRLFQHPLSVHIAIPCGITQRERCKVMCNKVSDGVESDAMDVCRAALRVVKEATGQYNQHINVAPVVECISRWGCLR